MCRQQPLLTKVGGSNEINRRNDSAIGAAIEAQREAPIRQVDEPAATVEGVHHAADDTGGEEGRQKPSVQEPEQVAVPLLPLRPAEGTRIIVMQRELGALELLLQGQAAGLLALVAHTGGWVDASSGSLD